MCLALFQHHAEIQVDLSPHRTDSVTGFNQARRCCLQSSSYWGEPERAPYGIEKRPPRTIYLSMYLCIYVCVRLSVNALTL